MACWKASSPMTTLVVATIGSLSSYEGGNVSTLFLHDTAWHRSLTRSSTSVMFPFSSYAVAMSNTGRWVVRGVFGLQKKGVQLWLMLILQVELGMLCFLSSVRINHDATPPCDVGPLKRFLCESVDANSRPKAGSGLHACLIMSRSGLSMHDTRLQHTGRRSVGQSIRASGDIQIHRKLWGAI
jgi:hypothetical protein